MKEVFEDISGYFKFWFNKLNIFQKVILFLALGYAVFVLIMINKNGVSSSPKEKIIIQKTTIIRQKVKNPYGSNGTNW
jgi:hypothetical protein